MEGGWKCFLSQVKEKFGGNSEVGRKFGSNAKKIDWVGNKAKRITKFKRITNKRKPKPQNLKSKSSKPK